MDKKKMFWMTLLFLTLLLFLIGLSQNNYLIYFLVIVMGLCIRVFGYDVLFKEYDEKRKRKYEARLAAHKNIKNKG